MTERSTAAISREDRERLRQISDVVFPRTAEMPSANDVGVSDVLVDRVVRAVPSLAADVSAALASTASDGEAALVEIRGSNRRLFNRLMLVIASAYYLSTEVRDRVGYHGQEARKLDFFEVSEYLEDGSLDRVIARGRRWIDVDPTSGEVT
jgi:hypothetical protein